MSNLKCDDYGRHLRKGEEVMESETFRMKAVIWTLGPACTHHISLAVYGLFALTSDKGYVLGLHIVAVSIACFGVVFAIVAAIYNKASVISSEV